MANIYNSELTKELTQGARLQVSRDIVPSQIAEKVVPVMEVNPKLLKNAVCKNARYNTSGTSRLLYTTEAGKDFYLTGAHLATVKDATCDMASGRVYMTIVQDGVTTTLLEIETLTLTALNSVVTQSFKFPLKLDRASSIYLNHTTFTAGNFAISGSVTGYYIENPNS